MKEKKKSAKRTNAAQFRSQIVQSAYEGLSVAEVAEQLNLSVNSVGSYWPLDVPSSKTIEIKYTAQQCCALRSSGMTVRRIAKELEISPSQVHYLLSRSGYNFTPDQVLVSIITTGLARKWDARQIAIHNKISRPLVILAINILTDDQKNSCK